MEKLTVGGRYGAEGVEILEGNRLAAIVWPEETPDFAVTLAKARLLAAAPALLAALEKVETRAEAMLDGSHRGPWSADYLRDIAREIRDIAEVAVEGARGEETS